MSENAARSRLGALAHRNFQLFFLGQGTSLVGTWMQSVALGWLVLDLTNSPFLVGLNSALRSFGVLLFTLYAGVVVDRVDKRRMIVITQILQMVEALILAALVWTHTVAVWQVMVLATFVGVVNAFDIPARQSFMVDLVGKDDLVNAIALNSSLFNATRIVGPAIAGIIIGASGVGLCFFLNGVSYLAVIWGLLAMRLPAFVERASPESEWERFRGGLRFILGDTRMTALVIQVAILSLFGFPVLVMMPVFARDVLHTGAGGYGALMAAVGAGAMLGALALALLSERVPKGRTLLAGGAAFSVLLGLFALSPWLSVSLGLLALTGCAMIVTTALTNTLLQTLVPDQLRGRVMGFYAFMFVGMAPLGAFQAGWLAERIGAPAGTAIGAGLCLAGMLISWWRVPELRETV